MPRVFGFLLILLLAAETCALQVNQSTTTSVHTTAASVVSTVAMKFRIDGSESDWKDFKAIIDDPEGDSEKGTLDTDLKAVYAVADEKYLYVMMEVWGKPPDLGNNYIFPVDLNGDGDWDYSFGFNAYSAWMFDLREVPNGQWPEEKSSALDAVYSVGNVAEIAIPLAVMDYPTRVSMLSWIYYPALKVTLDETEFGTVGIPAQSVDCPRSGTPVTIDGKWDGSEWDDGAELHLVSASGTGDGFVRVKYDDSYFYAIVDFISVSTASGTDAAAIQFDTNNDGGNKPKTDDYRFNADYRGQGSMAQGTGSDFHWGLPLPRGALVGASISSSPHSSKNHPIYEFRVPLSIFPKTSTARFAAAVWRGENTQNFVLVIWPENYYLVVPNTWGTINFGSPIPEFTSTFVIVALTIAVATLVSRIRRKERMYPQ